MRREECEGFKGMAKGMKPGDPELPFPPLSKKAERERGGMEGGSI